MKKKSVIWIALIPGVLVAAYLLLRKNDVPVSRIIHPPALGDAVDSLNGVKVYYNGSVGHTGPRNVSADGYNIGLRYQCVEFVKRYYYEYLHHKMPDSYGHAKDFFQTGVKDGKLNKQRNLLQFTNPSASRPHVNDLVVFAGHAGNPYGHVAIVSAVGDTYVEIIQQNPGPYASSRVRFDLRKVDGKWQVKAGRLLGWLRKV